MCYSFLIPWFLYSHFYLDPHWISLSCLNFLLDLACSTSFLHFWGQSSLAWASALSSFQMYSGWSVCSPRPSLSLEENILLFLSVSSWRCLLIPHSYSPAIVPSPALCLAHGVVIALFFHCLVTPSSSHKPGYMSGPSHTKRQLYGQQPEIRPAVAPGTTWLSTTFLFFLYNVCFDLEH